MRYTVRDQYLILEQARSDICCRILPVSQFSKTKGSPSSLSDLDGDDAMSSHESEDSNISDDPDAGMDN